MSGPRRVVYVTSPDRDSAGTLAGVLREFGLRVPVPETEPSRRDPRRRPESRWVAELHGSLLRSADVRTADPRPLSWHLADRAGTEANAPGGIRAWLEAQVGRHGDLVVADPRLHWFLELWQQVTTSIGARPSCVTVLRPPVDAVAGAAGAEAGREVVDRVAGWVNQMLGTELATRGAPRAFVRWADLIRDWDDPVFRAAAALDLPMVTPGDMAAVLRADALVDPAPHPADVTWQDLPVPAPLRGLADDTWAVLDALPGHDDAGGRAELDRLRALYPYVHRKVAASPARRIARMVPGVVPHVRRSVTGMLRRSPDAAG